MVFATINRKLRRQRQRLVVLALVLALSGAVLAAHSAMGSAHMGGGMAMCVAVLDVGAAAVAFAVVLSAPRFWRRPPWTSGRLVASVGQVTLPTPQPRARAGPLLQVFRL